MESSAARPEQSLVLRRQLPLPHSYVAPRTVSEETLSDIWRMALSMDCVGVEDSYHDLGGDSFLAAIIFGMIEEAFGIAIPMALLIDAPTVAALALEIDRRVAP
jgi:acyl carrier protein